MIDASNSPIMAQFRAACETPSDINEHMVTLFRYAQECAHITELGVRWVCSTWAFLAGEPGKLISYDIVFNDNIKYALDAAKAEGIDFEFRNQNVLEVELEPTELLFIDTWHVYDQCKKELELHAGKVEKYIIFHDTTSFENSGESPGYKGIWPAIEEFLAEHKEWQLKERYTNNNGLTVLERIND